MRLPDAIRRLVERALPWYEPELEAARRARTEGLRRRSIRARIALEERTAGVGRSYEAAHARVRRR